MAKVSEILSRLLLDNSDYIKNLDQSAKKLNEFGAAATSTGQTLLATGGVIAAALGFAVNQAGKMQATAGKFDQVFREYAHSARQWATELGRVLGRSEQQVMAFAASMQDILVPLGFSRGAATELSQSITELAYDLASFNDISDDQALNDLKAALTGSGEVMKKYGVILTETTLAQALQQQGIDPKKATEAEKAQARLNLIMAGSRDAMGDASRTAGEFGNQLKAAQAQLLNAATTVGNILLPAVSSALGTASAFLVWLRQWIAEHPGVVQSVKTIAIGLLAVGGSLVMVGGAAKAAALVVSGLGTTMKAVTLSVNALKAATLALAANPLILAFTALAAVGIAVGASLTASSREAAEALKRERDEAAKAAEDARKRANAVRAETEADQAKIATLRELSQQENLTAAQQAAAANLIRELTGRYGELGAGIDATTGKLVLQENAFAGATNAMRENQRLALETQAAAARREFQIAAAQYDSERFGAAAGAKILGYGGRKFSSWAGLSREEIETTMPQLDVDEQRSLNDVLKQQDAWVQAQRELAALQQGVSAPAETAAVGVTNRQYAEAEQKLAEISARMAQDRRNAAEKEIDALTALRRERLAQIDVMEKYQRQQLELAETEKIEAETAGRSADARAAANRVELFRRQLGENTERRSAVETDYATGVGKVRETHGAVARELSIAHQEARAKVDSDRANVVDQRQLDKLADINPEAYLRELGERIERQTAARDAADQAVVEAINRANEDGVIDDRERADIGRKRDAYALSQAQLENYQQRLDRATDERGAGQSYSSFSAAALAIMGGGTAADRTAAATEKTATVCESIAIQLVTAVEGMFLQKKPVGLTFGERR